MSGCLLRNSCSQACIVKKVALSNSENKFLLLGWFLYLCFQNLDIQQAEGQSRAKVILAGRGLLRKSARAGRVAVVREGWGGAELGRTAWGPAKRGKGGQETQVWYFLARQEACGNCCTEFKKKVFF